MKKKALVCHSGGMDSSICLALACREFGVENVLSLSFDYDQRHSVELAQAAKISQHWLVDHVVLNLSCLKEITTSALIGSTLNIEHHRGEVPNTLVMGRNGLMAHLGGIHAHHLGAHCLYMGVLELEEANCGYRDCSRRYIDMHQEILKIDLDDPNFEIRTPLVKMRKKETLELANSLGILEFLLEETVTCYEGIRKKGCEVCPACILRNRGIEEYFLEKR